jgi:Na+-transporting NADH:ubiquinone oxidoreductase subunit C
MPPDSKGPPDSEVPKGCATPRNSSLHTLWVATVLCVVCSVLVSGAAVGLRDIQEANKQLDQQKNVLIAAGLFHLQGDDETKNTNADIPQLFESVEKMLINLETGAAVDSATIDPTTYNPRTAAKAPELSLSIPVEKDLAGIQRREKYTFVFVIRKNEKIDQVVLPIYGKGLWSTLYGYLALDADTTTVRGITFYEHAETPGLGGEVDNISWKALWKNKKLFDDQGEVALEVVKGMVPSDSPQVIHQIDGLSGATITSRGVSNLVRYWLGPDGFGPYLEKLRKENQTALSSIRRMGGDHG